MQGTVRRASCPQLVLDKKKVGHFFFGFSKTKDAKIWKWHFSEKHKKHQPSSTKICPKRSNDILYYQTTKCPQFSVQQTNQVSMHGSPHQVHDATIGATSQEGPKMMGLGYPVDSGLRYGHFWYLYVSVRFLGCNKKVPPMFWHVWKKTVETSSELQGVLCSAVCEQKSETRDRD